MRHVVKKTLAFALVGGLAGCGAEAPADPSTKAPLVRPATVAGRRALSRAFTGTVAARVQTDLGFRVPGKVAQRLVNAGQKVRRGQILMRIDPADLQLSAQAQQQAVVAAQAQARQAIADEARYRALRGTGA